MEGISNNVQSANVDWSKALSGLAKAAGCGDVAVTTGVENGKVTFSVSNPKTGAVVTKTFTPELDPAQIPEGYDVEEVKAQVTEKLAQLSADIQSEETKQYVNTAVAAADAGIISSSSTGYSGAMFSIAEIVALILETSQEMKDLSREMREIDLQTSITLTKAEADAQRAAAKTGMWTTIGLAVGMAAVTTTVSAVGAGMGAKAEGAKTEMTTRPQTELDAILAGSSTETSGANVQSSYGKLTPTEQTEMNGLMGELQTPTQSGTNAQPATAGDTASVGSQGSKTSQSTAASSANGAPKVEANGAPKVEANGAPKTEANGAPKTEANGAAETEANGAPKTEANGAPKTEANGALKTEAEAEATIEGEKELDTANLSEAELDAKIGGGEETGQAPKAEISEADQNRIAKLEDVQKGLEADTDVAATELKNAKAGGNKGQIKDAKAKYNSCLRKEQYGRAVLTDEKAKLGMTDSLASDASKAEVKLNTASTKANNNLDIKKLENTSRKCQIAQAALQSLSGATAGIGSSINQAMSADSTEISAYSKEADARREEDNDLLQSAQEQIDAAISLMKQCTQSSHEATSKILA